MPIRCLYFVPVQPIRVPRIRLPKHGCAFSLSCHYVFGRRTERVIFSRDFFPYTLPLYRILHIYFAVWCLDFIGTLGLSLLPLITFQLAIGGRWATKRSLNENPGHAGRKTR